MTLRDYQQDAVTAAIDWVRKSTAPCVIEAPTGAGKSHIIAELARLLTEMSGGKKVLVIAPSAELVVQDHAKYVASTGLPASFFSASVGEKSVRHPVVFGTPGSVKNSLDVFADYAAIILDEAHRVTPTLGAIVDHLRERNGNLRVIGLTATPYRMGDGYIYQSDERGKSYGEEHAKRPYFARRVYTIQARHLIDRGYLTSPVCDAPEAEYDTSGLETNRMGAYTSESVDRAFFDQATLTEQIVGLVIEAARDRSGVLFFASTIRHAEQVLAALPEGECAMVTGETPKKERGRILAEFKLRKIKYLVNVDVLTTGFDAPHVDVVAILRATESVSLLQQIVGRGLRISEGKSDCLVLDFAGNIERHCPDGDIFSPKIRARRDSSSEPLECMCPVCNAANEFAANPKALDMGTANKHGYVVDLTGQALQTEYGPMPAHFGRRCNGIIWVGREPVRCSYRWTCKQCPHCDADNDIAARYCNACKEELVSPEKKLSLEYARYKQDPKKVQCDTVLRWDIQPHVGRGGAECFRVAIKTAYRSFVAYLFPPHPCIVSSKNVQTVTYQKRGDFYRIIAINQPEDKHP